MNCAANYYDGKIARPQSVHLTFHDMLEPYLSFSIEGRELRWPLTELEHSHLGNRLEIRHRSLPYEFVSITDEESISAAAKILKTRGNISLYAKLLGAGLVVHLAIVAVIIGVIAGAYFYVVPYLAEKAVHLIPQSFDDTLGDGAYEQFTAYSTVDSSKSLLLNEFASQLKLNNTKPLHFTVIEEDVVNAFALPDGHIVVYTGILDKMQDPEELVALLGHESAHVNNRHSMKMMCRNLAGYFVISMMLSDVNGIMAVLADNAHSLQNLSYSRTFESEADRDGYHVMLSNHVDPQGMVKLFDRLNDASEGEDEFSFLRSHPLTDDRIKEIEELISKGNGHPVISPKLKALFTELKMGSDR